MTNMVQRRYHDLDFARAIPLLGLPFVHCYEEFELAGFLPENVLTWGQIFLFLCILGPSVFMMGLGMNITFTSHNTDKELAERGLKTIKIFFILNVLRYVLPAGIYGLTGHPDGFAYIYEFFFSSDILFFAGLAFLAFALARHLKMTPFAIIILSMCMLAGNMLIPQLDISNIMLRGFLGNFFYVDDGSCFPLLSWLIFPAAGYAMGSYIKKIQTEAEQDAFYKKLIATGIVTVLGMGICLKSYGLDPLLIAASPANSYITDMFNVILDIGIAFIWFSLIHFLYKKITSMKVKKAADLISRSILIFFCIQWVIVEWTMYLLKFAGYTNIAIFNNVSFAIVSTVIFAASMAIAVYMSIRKDKKMGYTFTE